VVVPAHEVRDRGGLAAFASAHERKGDWELPRLFRIACALGSVAIDLREARISEGVTEIEVVLFMGSIELFVPPGVRVEVEVSSFMGEVEHRHDPTIQAEPGAPVLRVTGSAYLGSVEVMARLPGESARDAKRRIRAASKAPSRQIGW
jgi:hypothetical protein